ncbi:MAG: fructosamine kinase family protein [Planctomycetota bacterium]|jgi:fructosamine-3-kinase
MSDAAAIAEALASAGRSTRIVDRRDCSGGCMHRVTEVTLDDGPPVIAKLDEPSCAGIFEEEAAGLRALAATATVLVPDPIAVGTFAGRAVLIMTALEPAPPGTDAWHAFGHALADLHAADAGPRYGFETDNHLGRTRQPNAWTDDWVEFNRAHRLGFQRRLASERGLLKHDEESRLRHLEERLDELIPRHPHPALLHGDLWSGNALPTRDDRGSPRIAVIDPACSIGDGWADIAMMGLFGGFSPECFEAYAERASDREGVEQRVAVYQLYHLLNHVNLFGRGYAGQAMSVVGALGS